MSGVALCTSVWMDVLRSVWFERLPTRGDIIHFAEGKLPDEKPGSIAT